MTESNFRSLVKAISWRVFATLITFSIAYFITGETWLAVKIGLLDTLIKILVYFLHERMWGKIKLGKKLHPLEDIELSKEMVEEDKKIIREKLKELGYIED